MPEPNPFRIAGELPTDEMIDRDAEAARLLQYVAEATGTGIDTVTWAVLDVFDAERDTWQADPRIRSPVAASSPRPQAADTPAAATDPPAALPGRARHAFPSPPRPSSSPSTAGDHHPVPGVTSRHAGRSR